ncbi:MAG: hypothetical protein DMF64_01175 [Acidobacteria bacterium]|nr:MAG: hypothetical protein DMF64_01175 [Acidobacteriota bacterium]
MVGTWDISVTLRNCQTGAALRTFPALASFAAGGTVIEVTTGLSPARCGPGQGVWRHMGGNTYRATIDAFLFDAEGVWTGTQRLTQIIEVRDERDEFKANATNEIFDTDDRLIQTDCATAVGRRLESVVRAETPQLFLSERSIR